MDTDWVSLPRRQLHKKHVAFTESISDRCRRVGKDIEDVLDYYRVTASSSRYARLNKYYRNELESLLEVEFDTLDQQSKVDFLQLRNFLRRKTHQLQDEWKVIKDVGAVIPFAAAAITLSEARESAKALPAQEIAQHLDDIAKLAVQAKKDVESGKIKSTKLNGYKAAKLVSNIQGAISELSEFYSSYDPLFDWWTKAPLAEAIRALAEYLSTVKQRLAGMQSDKQDEIIGEPIGREAVLVELDAEMIAYTPEELLGLANDVYKWCEIQMKAASSELGFGDDWKKALDYVKNNSVQPGEQPELVKNLLREGSEFVQKNDLLTVPSVIDETCRMFMMSPEQQKVAPFFLGGSAILVAYPTTEMSHDLKKMVMRGNNRHFARATAFHEIVPGHKMQEYYNTRYNTHRGLFSTPFWVEGWAMYWELLFWSRGDFFVSPEDRIGTMFWRMHRCARIIFSLNFHLGKMSAQECVDLLVNWVGHERSTAEGEVRRSFAGDYPPLYQAGYMLGALQLWGLRKEVLEQNTDITERHLHDTILWNGNMPIELLRALLLKKPLQADYKAKWKFYETPN